MQKSGLKKPSSKSKRTTKPKIEKKLIENLVELQKIHTNLAEKFSSLEKQISSLLNLFENAAKNFASNPAIKESEKDKEFLEKIDKLLDQNKTIARGLTLMEGKFKERIYGPTIPTPQQNQDNEYQPGLNPSNRPLPRF